MIKISALFGKATNSTPTLSKVKAASISSRIAHLESQQKKLIRARHIAPEPYTKHIEEREAMIVRSIKHLKGRDER